MLEKTRDKWLVACVWMFGVLQAGRASAQTGGDVASDVLGPAAKIADDTRLSPGWGILGGIVVLCMAAFGVGLKEKRLLFGAGLLLGAILIWYNGAAIIRGVIPTTGERMAN